MIRAITIALVLITVVSGSLAAALHNLALAGVAAVALLLLVAAAAGAGRVAAKTDHLKGRAATLHVWGSAPSSIGEANVVVEQVWALGAGLHFHVTPHDGTSSIHIKVAQPRRWSIGVDGITILEAKYVQIEGTTIGRVAGCPALALLLN